MTAVPSVPVPDLDTIRGRADKATPGPWRILSPDSTYSTVTDADYRQYIATTGGSMLIADAEFIAHARTDVPALIAALESAQARLVAVEAERDTLREAAKKAIGFCTVYPIDSYHAADILRCALSVVPGEREQ